MADVAWTEVHALTDNPGPKPGTETHEVIPVAVQESAFTYFHAYTDATDWRVRDFAIQAVCFFPNGNKLFVTETYEQLQALVKLKRR